MNQGNLPSTLLNKILFVFQERNNAMSKATFAWPI